MATNYLEQLIKRLPELAPLESMLNRAVLAMRNCSIGGGKILACGNGGSAADAEHIVAELMKGFLLKRPLTERQKKMFASSGCPPELYNNLQRPIPAISLVSGVALPTAIANDIDATICFAQQVLALGRAEDILLAISTSGNSQNIIYAAMIAKAQGLKVIAFTGSKENRLSALADLCISAPSQSTPLIQEYHVAIYHAICAQLENLLFGSDENGSEHS